MRVLTVAHPDKCVGCKVCEIICSLTHEGVCGPTLSKIRVQYDLFTGNAEIVITKNCDLCKGETECLKWCPSGVLRYGKD